MLLSYEVPDVLLEEFYIHSRHAINDCILINFNSFIIKNKWYLPVRHTCVDEQMLYIYCYRIWILEKKNKFCLLLKVNVLFLFQCK